MFISVSRIDCLLTGKGRTMLVKTFLKFSFLIFFIVTFGIPAFPRAYSPEKDFEPEKIKGFINYLIENREYYRASVEVERLKSYYPDYIKQHQYTAAINYLMYKGEAYEEIYGISDSDNKDDYLAEKISIFFKIDSLIKMRMYDKAERLIPPDTGGDDVFFKSLFEKRKMYFSLMGKEYGNLKNNVSQYNNYRDQAVYSEYIHNRKKDPWKGMAAGIIPGMGYVYAGEQGTGITAMIVTGLGAALTAASWKNDIKPLSIVSGTVTSLFYGGSIIGGYRETLRYNRGLMERLDLKLQRDFDFNSDVEEVYFRFGLKN